MTIKEERELWERAENRNKQDNIRSKKIKEEVFKSHPDLKFNLVITHFVTFVYSFLVGFIFNLLSEIILIIVGIILGFLQYMQLSKILDILDCIDENEDVSIRNLITGNLTLPMLFNVPLVIIGVILRTILFM